MHIRIIRDSTIEFHLDIRQESIYTGSDFLVSVLNDVSREVYNKNAPLKRDGKEQYRIELSLEDPTKED